MTTQPLAICFACTRLWPTPDENTNTALLVACDAYPKGIPGPIKNGFDHRKPFGGEKEGRLFDQADGQYAEIVVEAFDRREEE